MAKIKTYVILISKRFPETHAKAGQWTNFRNRIIYGSKIHTIRTNLELWEKRIKEVQSGAAILSLREWIHEPYKSKQRNIKDLDASSGIGIQRLQMRYDGYIIDGVKFIPENSLAKNDGLYPEDFLEWFKGYPKDKLMPIIHFTNFRY